MRTAASVPGPGAYESPSLGREVSGGRFNMSAPKGIAEQAVYNSRHNPGPAAYNPSQNLSRMKGGKMYTKPEQRVGSLDVMNMEQLYNSLHPGNTITATKKTYKSSPPRARERRRQAQQQRAADAQSGQSAKQRNQNRQLTRSGLLIIRPHLLRGGR